MPCSGDLDRLGFGKVAFRQGLIAMLLAEELASAAIVFKSNVPVVLFAFMLNVMVHESSRQKMCA